jgi:hypothetical protein
MAKNFGINCVQLTNEEKIKIVEDLIKKQYKLMITETEIHSIKIPIRLSMDFNTKEEKKVLCFNYKINNKEEIDRLIQILLKCDRKNSDKLIKTSMDKYFYDFMGLEQFIAYTQAANVRILIEEDANLIWANINTLYEKIKAAHELYPQSYELHLFYESVDYIHNYEDNLNKYNNPQNQILLGLSGGTAHGNNPT